MARRLERESSTRTLAQAHQLGLDAWLPLSH
jgi:hypothetical protein